MADAQRSITVAVPAAQAWEVLADLAAIVDWTPNVEHSTMLTDRTDGIGATRRVQVGRLALVETVVVWEPPARLAYTIRGLPARLGEIATEWRVAEGPGGCEITLVNSVDPGPRPPQQVLGRIAARRLAASSDKMLAGLADHLDQGAHR